MIDAIKPLIESGIINEATRDAINEAWQSKLNEARNEIRAEIREEFAERYEHDKENMIEALEKMTSETLTAEIKKVQEERQEAIAHKVKIVKEMKAVAKKFNSFLTSKLAEELKEFRADRKKYTESVNKLEGFVMKSLAEEITEFAEDKQDLARTKVKLVSEANGKFTQLKNRFVKRSSKAVQETIEKALRSELKQLREDISAARQNNFGRKIFEAFANEFSTSYLNENKEMRTLRDKLTQVTKKLSEANSTIAKKDQLIESKKVELTRITKRNERDRVLKELMSPLAKDKQAVMAQLLENVQTDKLKVAYDKYLPSVLNNTAKRVQTTLTEGVVTGDKKSAKTPINEDDDKLLDIKRLAGLN